MINTIFVSFAWIALIGAACFLCQIKDGFSKLDIVMRLLCTSALCFMFPILADSIYIAGETTRKDDDIIHVQNYKITLSEEQQRKGMEEYYEKTGIHLSYEEYMQDVRSNEACWENLTAEQKVVVDSEKIDDDGNIIVEGKYDEEDYDISAVVAMFIIGVCASIASLWFIYFVL